MWFRFSVVDRVYRLSTSFYYISTLLIISLYILLKLFHLVTLFLLICFPFYPVVWYLGLLFIVYFSVIICLIYVSDKCLESCKLPNLLFVIDLETDSREFWFLYRQYAQWICYLLCPNVLELWWLAACAQQFGCYIPYFSQVISLSFTCFFCLWYLWCKVFKLKVFIFVSGDTA